MQARTWFAAKVVHFIVVLVICVQEPPDFVSGIAVDVLEAHGREGVHDNALVQIH